MNLWNMSFSGAILIAAIIVVRAGLIHRLPKRTFLALWGVVLLRLLIPFSIPSRLSVYSFMNRSTSVGESFSSRPASDFIPPPETPAKPLFTDGVALPAQALQNHGGISFGIVIWCVGAMLCALFFIASYLHWRFKFKTSLPVSDPFITRWLGEHRLRRSIAVRQSGSIGAPLTYGLFRPVILLPQKTDWGNEQQLQYVLLHEYVHICRYDIAAKWISGLALCIHWFNPMVWVMYILFNRDIELACDECVIRKLGENAKSMYAHTLIRMEEKKGGLMPIGNNFSKNAIEERITAIMKIKKTSFWAMMIGAALVAGMTTVFATSAAAGEKRSMEAPAADFSDEEYEKLLALQFDGYENMSVAEYQEKVWKMTDTAPYRNLLERFSQNEKLYEMKDRNETASFLFYVLEPLTAEKWQSRKFGGYAAADYPQASDNASLEYAITLQITDAETLTVGEYIAARQNAVRELENLMKSMTTSELRDEELMHGLIDEVIAGVTEMYEISGLNMAIQYVFVPLGELAVEDMEEWQQERQEEWDLILAPYVPFGLTYEYDFATDDYKMYFQGKEVRGIVDEREGLWITEHSGSGKGIYEENAVELYAVYENDELAGLREATKEEQKEWSDMRQKTSDEGAEALETREYPHGTREDYKSLFALKTPDYSDRSVADFNQDLLEWANEDYDRMERINTDMGRNDFQVSLDSEELSFVKWTVYLSGTENGKYVQSSYTGGEEEEPVYNGYLPEKAAVENGRAAWCSLWYQFSYAIADKEAITVGERDLAVQNMAGDIEKFWKETGIEEMLQMTESDVVRQLQEIARKYSNEQITITMDEEQVQFECMDERSMD